MKFSRLERVSLGKMSSEEAMAQISEEMQKAQKSGDKKKVKILTQEAQMLIQLDVPDPVVDRELETQWSKEHE